MIGSQSSMLRVRALVILMIYAGLWIAFHNEGVLGIGVILVAGTGSAVLVLKVTRQTAGEYLDILVHASAGAFFGQLLGGPFLLHRLTGYNHGRAEAEWSDLIAGIIGTISGVAFRRLFAPKPPEPAKPIANL
jgi:hypothetical protein